MVLARAATERGVSVGYRVTYARSPDREPRPKCEATLGGKTTRHPPHNRKILPRYFAEKQLPRRTMTRSAGKRNEHVRTVGNGAYDFPGYPGCLVRGAQIARETHRRDSRKETKHGRASARETKSGYFLRPTFPHFPWFDRCLGRYLRLPCARTPGPRCSSGAHVSRYPSTRGSRGKGSPRAVRDLSDVSRIAIVSGRTRNVCAISYSRQSSEREERDRSELTAKRNRTTTAAIYLFGLVNVKQMSGGH